MKKMIYFLLIITGLICLAIIAYMQLPKFGKHPSGKRLERVEKSPHYKNGAFQNIEELKLLQLKIKP